MEIFTTKNIGKLFFWLSFILGSICLFGYVFTKDIQFAIAGYFLLIYGVIINLIVIFVLLIYGFSQKEYFEDCKKSILMILINLPIAILYAWIGLSLIDGL